MMFQFELPGSIKSGEYKLYTQSIFDTFGQHFKQDKNCSQVSNIDRVYSLD